MTDNDLFRAFGALEANVKAVGEDVRGIKDATASLSAAVHRRLDEQNERLGTLERKDAYHRGAAYVIVALISVAVTIIGKALPSPF